MGHIIPAFTVYLARICLNYTKNDFLYIRHSYSPVENLTPAASWWARVVPTHLLPKETDLQSAAVADLLLTHMWWLTTDSNRGHLAYAFAIP